MREERTVWVEGRPCVVVLSDEREALLAAQAAGRAVVGVGCGPDLPAAYLTETADGASRTYLERVARRHLGLPWVIAGTERLIVREFRREDAGHVPAGERFSPADEIFCSEEKLDAYIRCQYRFYEYGIWAVTEKAGGKLVGKAGVSGMEQDENGVLWIELGYHIFMPYRRRGYATEACRGILAYLEEEYGSLGPYRVCAKTDAGNTASVKVGRLCGLELIGIQT